MVWGQGGQSCLSAWSGSEVPQTPELCLLRDRSPMLDVPKGVNCGGWSCDSMQDHFKTLEDHKVSPSSGLNLWRTQGAETLIGTASETH